MEKKTLEELRQLLLKERARVLSKSTLKDSGEQFTLNKEDLIDENDHAAAVVQQSVQLEVHERNLKLLAEIDRALAKISIGNYGICEDTEEPIDVDRLRAQPWTRYCVEAAELKERRLKKFA